MRQRIVRLLLVTTVLIVSAAPLAASPRNESGDAPGLFTRIILTLQHLFAPSPNDLPAVPHP